MTKTTDKFMILDSLYYERSRLFSQKKLDKTLDFNGKNVEDEIKKVDVKIDKITRTL